MLYVKVDKDNGTNPIHILSSCSLQFLPDGSAAKSIGPVRLEHGGGNGSVLDHEVDARTSFVEGT